MADLVHITARIEPETRNALRAIAKQRMMATGEPVTMADLVREALRIFVNPEEAGRVITTAQEILAGCGFTEVPADFEPHEVGVHERIKPYAKALHELGKSQREIAAILGVRLVSVARALGLPVE